MNAAVSPLAVDVHEATFCRARSAVCGGGALVIQVDRSSNFRRFIGLVFSGELMSDPVDAIEKRVEWD